MASQWEINNKKVKDWTIGGKKVKSITFANGKVLNFGGGGISSEYDAITVKATDYARINIASNSIVLYNVKNDYWESLGGTTTPYPPLNKQIAIQVNANGTITPGAVLKNVNLYNNENGVRKGFSITFATTNKYNFVAGHTYLFENHKDPVDLGSY